MSRLCARFARVGWVASLVIMGSACSGENTPEGEGSAGTPGSAVPAEGGAAGHGTAGEPGSSAEGGTGAEAGGAAAGEPSSSAEGGAAASSAGAASVAGGPGSNDCGELDANGACSGDRLDYCADGELVSIDCALIGASCSVAGAEATCTALERAMPCGKLTKLGTCDGAMMRYCDETGDVGVAREINCAAYGQECDSTAGQDGGADCVSYGSCPNGVDEDGVCNENDNELRFCEGSELYVFDCGMDECRSVDGFADCFAPDFEDGCGEVPVEGTCMAGVLNRCLGNVVTREDCATLGLECVEDDTGASCQRGDCAAGCVSGYQCSDGLCAPESEPERDWTVALYSVADNSLSDALWRDLNEIELVGSNADVQVVAQIEFSETFSGAVPEQYRTGAYRMEVQQDDDSDSSASLEAATDLGDDVDMGSEASLTSFLRWAAENYPARRMALVLANHGGGYQGGFFDEGSENAMNLREMVDGVRESTVHLDMLAMDACMMGMHEVGMAFRGLADVLVASPDPEPGGGYPYTPIMSALQGDSGMTAAELGEQIVNEYTAEYTAADDEVSKGRAVTIGVTDLQTLPALNEQLAGFAQTVLTNAAGMRSKIKDAVSSTDLMRAASIPSITDIGSILTVFSTLDGPIGRSAGEVNTWLGQSGPVLSKRGTEPKENTSGLGIYLPEAAWTHSTAYSSYWTSTSFLPLGPWFAFVGNLSTGEEEVITPGEGAVDSFSVVLTWGSEPNGTESSADMDLYVYEPNGEFGTPANGKTTQNGLLSGDSYDTEIARESYELKPDHQAGTYLVLVNLYWIEAGDQAYPRLQIYRNDVPGGVRTLIRGKIVDRELQEIPMDDSNLLDETIDSSNLQDVLNLDYSNLWYATTIEVSADSEEAP